MKFRLRVTSQIVIQKSHIANLKPLIFVLKLSVALS